MTKITLNISGMHCSSCGKLIKMKLDKQPGVIRAEVDDVKKQARIDIDPSQTNIADIKNLINDFGYQSEEA
jgi:Cu+-exporting ATPase